MAIFGKRSPIPVPPEPLPKNGIPAAGVGEGAGEMRGDGDGLGSKAVMLPATPVVITGEATGVGLA